MCEACAEDTNVSKSENDKVKQMEMEKGRGRDEILIKPPKAKDPGQDWNDPISGMKLKWIPSGIFHYGNPFRKEIKLTKGFWLGKYPVTQEQWEAVMGSNPSYFDESGRKAPVERVSYHDCQEYIRKLNDEAGAPVYRLPTEAEWMHALKAGTPWEIYRRKKITEEVPGFFSMRTKETEIFDLDSIAWHLNNSEERTHPVGKKFANVWGLHDMLGNVWEWCSDWDDLDYFNSSDTNPKGPSKGKERVVMGGSINVSWASWNSTDFRFRWTKDPNEREVDLGFRLARDSTI